MKDEIKMIDDIANESETYNLKHPKDVTVKGSTARDIAAWVCYASDEYDRSVVVKVVGSKSSAESWIAEAPVTLGKSDGRRHFCEMFMVRG